MISNPRQLCTEPRCKEPAVYGVVRQLHCVLHALQGEAPLVGGTCVSCGLVDVLDAQFRCSVCDPEVFKRVRLAKQREVKVLLDNSGHGDYVVYDKALDNGECGKERPDFAFDCGTHFLVLEVDENQHDDRQELCECTRMINLSQSVGMKTVFLRYNPDVFKSHGRKCNPTVNHRHSTLLKWLTYLRSTVPEHFLSAVFLFYDDYEEGCVPIVSVA